MTAEVVLNTALTDHAPLTALVAARIWPDAMPDGTSYPAVTFSRSATERIVTIHGQVVAEEVTFTISSWSESRTAADAVADAIEAALAAAGHNPGDRASGYDDTLGLFGTVVNVTLFITP